MDEADNIHKGFVNDLRVIEDEMKPKQERQTLMFSATFTIDLITRIGRTSMRNNYKLIEVGEIGSAQLDVTQMFKLVESDYQKSHSLKEILYDLLTSGIESFQNCNCWRDHAENRPTLADFYLHVLGVGAEKKIIISIARRSTLIVDKLHFQIADYLCGILTGRYRQIFNHDTSLEDQNESGIEFGVIP